MLQAQDLLSEYANQLVEVQEIHGATTYSIVLTFEQSGPIITYAPTSFVESQDDTVYRCFMPNTAIGEQLEHNAPDIIQQSDSGVELVLMGKFLKKIVGDMQVVIQMGVIK